MCKIKNGVPLNSFPLDINNKYIVWSSKINWSCFDFKNGVFKEGFVSIQPPRRIFGLKLLERALKIDGASLLEQWRMIPYYQYFTGENWFHWELPITEGELMNCEKHMSDYGKELLDSQTQLLEL